MADLMVTRGNLDEAMALIQDEIERNHVALVSVSSGNTGKWGISRLWRSWMASVAKWMAEQGATMPLCISANGEPYGSRPFNSDDAHLLFTHQLLGCDADGTRLSWAKAPHDGIRVAGTACTVGKMEVEKANANRIAKCVNACAGMADPAAEIAELKQQRDELMVALQGMIDIAADSQGVVGYYINRVVAERGEFEEWQAACDAIAKAKGGAA